MEDGLAPKDQLFFSLVEEHKVETNKDKGDAEPLSHVEGHALLEAHLVILEALYEEAEGENLRQAKAEEETFPVSRAEVGEGTCTFSRA